MRILVTGGAGFIASHIVDAYVARGHAVEVIDNLSTGRESNLNPRAVFHRADIRDAATVEEIMRSGRFDVVSHHAAQMDVRRSVADPVYDASVNVLGVLTLLECAARYRVQKMIFASSGGAIYGEQQTFPADETHPTRPISPYGVSKLTTEHYLYYYHAVHGLASVSLRYANVYGPRQNPEGEAGVVAIFTSKMLRHEQPVINGDGRQTRDYVFVGDVVRANLLALDRKGCEVYNIGTGIETDVNTLFRILREATGSGCEERHGQGKKGEQLRSLLSAARAASELAWRPEVPLYDGLVQTVEYFKRSSPHGTPTGG